MSYRGELFLSSFTSSQYLFSCCRWNELLQFYIENKTSLDEEDTLRLYELSEQCRQSVNKPKKIIKDGTAYMKPGLNIKKDEVFSTLYKDAELIKEKQRQEYLARSFTPVSSVPLTVLPSEYHLNFKTSVV